ncbi:Inactive rhomboid protein 1 [Morus notabilis]|uniref:RHOMBOID-like protein n=1 Tax=Morus notabilis TaxID=981085 RepID=W9SIR5_9ROSA|nr:Inactive rhomboid protein 1 [Morus notabilis]
MSVHFHMFSPIMVNWIVCYADGGFIITVKLAALITLIVIIVLNLAVGVLPHVDNFAHIGGFVSGFLLGFVFLIRPQFRWISQKYASSGHRVTSVTKHKTYQYALWIISMVLLLLGRFYLAPTYVVEYTYFKLLVSYGLVVVGAELIIGNSRTSEK